MENINMATKTIVIVALKHFAPKIGEVFIKKVINSLSGKEVSHEDISGSMLILNTILNRMPG